MKKIALVLVVLAVAVSPAAAKKKHHRHRMTTASAQKYDPNEASWRLVRDALPLVLPTWAMPIYFNMHRDAAKKM